MSISAPIFEIQRFSLHDGPGIRTSVFMKGCALRCPWCQNPESQSARPMIAFHANRCDEAFECAVVCPKDAIRHEGYRVDHETCDRCGLCVEACPHEALRPIGENLAPEELMARLLPDLPYFRSSGGGVTFTGGEPTVHHRFLHRALELCVEAGIDTNVETSGRFSWDLLEPVLEMCNLIYFDLKILDPELHRRHLGDDLDLILANAERLAARGFPVEFRMPLVAGFTDSDDNIESVIDFLSRVGKKSVHLLTYHNMGEAKIDIIDGCQPRLGLPAFPDDRFAQICSRFENRGIVVVGRADRAGTLP